MDAKHDVQRTVPRYTFVAVAELIETASTTCVVGRIVKISRKGCYVENPNPLPVDTFLNIVISHDDGTFTTNGKVIYVRERIGMGIVFLDSTEEQLKVLDSWLSELSNTKSL